MTPLQRFSREVADALGQDNVIDDDARMQEYARDMADYQGSPRLVVRPGSEEEVSLVVRAAARHGVPVVPRGAGSSLTGASVSDSVVLDTRRLDRIIEVDTVNWHAKVQAGVVLDTLNRELKGRGFFFPPDPASSFVCTVGGAVAEGSGGFRCVKYGTMKEWVLALRVVLPNGEVAQLGEPLAKNRAGYDLVHLFVGSEGTLGVVTEACLRVVPLQSTPARRMAVQFDDWGSATRAVMGLKSARVVPGLLEFMDRETLEAVNRVMKTGLPAAEATLLVDLDDGDAGTAEEVFRSSGMVWSRVAEDEEEAELMYQARAWAYPAVKGLASGVHVEDVVVPIDRLGEYMKKVKEAAAGHGLTIAVNGHAGDGNVHPLILYDRADEGSRDRALRAFGDICRSAIGVGGSVSGEHGIGLQKTQLLGEQLRAHGGGEALRLMKEIKRLFDPAGIMNPGKYVEAA